MLRNPLRQLQKQLKTLQTMPKKLLLMLKKKQKMLLTQLSNTVPLAEKRILMTQSPFLFMPLLISYVLSDLIIMKYV